jgi:uncharacterized protein YcaQ
MTHSAGPELTLYLREGTAGPSRARQDAARQRARNLVDAGVAADLTVETWEPKVAVEGTEPRNEPVLSAFNAFSDWARTRDVRLYPVFQTRECYSWEDGSRYTALVMPVMCLTISTGETLDAVYPHVDEETYNVFDGLAILAASRHEPPSDADSSVPAE